MPTIQRKGTRVFIEHLARRFPGVLIAAAIMAVTMAQLHARQGREQQLLVSVQEGRLSVRTGTVPLETVLRAIEDAADLRVTITGELGSVRPQAFDGVTLEEGLRRLAGDRHPLVMVYGSDPDRSGTRVLKEVRVYGDPQQEGQGAKEESAARARSHPPRTPQIAAGTPAERYLYGSDSTGTEAAKQLEEGSDDDVQLLTAALDDREDRVRLRALRALQGDQALEHLSKVARSDPAPELRQAAIYMLGGLAAGETRRILQAALADPDERVRQAAAQMLSQLRVR